MAGFAVRRRLRDAAQRRARMQRQARRALAGPHRTIVVALLGTEESEHALDLACRLAADRGARVLLVAPLFVDPELPLDAHFDEDEAALRVELARTRALASSYGVTIHERVVRTRHGQLGAAVAQVAEETRATLIVVGAPIDSRNGFKRPFSRDVWSVLKDAPCRVMIATGSLAAVTAGRAAA
jgi:nucleotide-binding universal stress UspA family protein